MIAIYLPIIREEVHAYVEIWNNHTIQAQKNRPHIVAGKPKFNYFFSGKKRVPDYGKPIDPELVNRLQADTAEWGKNACIFHMHALIYM